MSPPLSAQSINLGYIQTTRQDDNIVLGGDLQFSFNSHLEEALTKGGITINLVAEFQVTQGRWYWFDEFLIKRKQNLRLSYNALTQQYRIQIGGSNLSQSFTRFDLVMRYISNLANWGIKWRIGILKNDNTYEVSLRIYLDKSELPRTFQLGAIANSDWVLDSGLYRWQLTPNYDWVIR